jgi:hypothetical protein
MKHWLFWIFWGVDALATLVALFFFVLGLEDGSVSSFNIALWMEILVGVLGIVIGSLVLRSKGWVIAGIVLLCVLALPVLGWVLMFAIIFASNPRWN